MEYLNRPPTKSESVLSAIFTAFTSLIFGGVAAFALTSKPIMHITAIIYSLLFLVSITMFFRATFTPRRSLSEKEKLGFAYAQLVGGSAGLLLSYFLASTVNQRLLILGA